MKFLRTTFLCCVIESKIFKKHNKFEWEKKLLVKKKKFNLQKEVGVVMYMYTIQATHRLPLSLFVLK
jgi:hypothetical protein